MNKDEENEIIKKWNFAPIWVKDKQDALTYAKHLNFRLIQKTKYLEKLWEILKKADPKLHMEISNSDELLALYGLYEDLYNKGDELV